MKTNIYPNPWDLRYFQEIAQTQNLSRAAERLGVGQPALSLALKRLEDGLGVALFYRRNKGLAPTSAGLRLLKETNLLLSNWEAVVSQTKKSETELVGRFSIGCHPSVGLYALDRVVKQIYTDYPGIEIQLVHGLSRVVCERVISGEIDFGIIVNPVKHPDLVIHKLATDQVSFWRVRDAIEDVLICNPVVAQTQALLLKTKGKFTRTITSESFEVVATMARAGIGTAILPTRVVRVFSDELQRVDKLPSYHDEITFVYRSDLVKTASARALIEAIRAVRI